MRLNFLRLVNFTYLSGKQGRPAESGGRSVRNMEIRRAEGKLCFGRIRFPEVSWEPGEV